MGLEQAFEVATEFRFDVGRAVINTDALRGAVDDLSKSADSALGSLNYLAGGLIAHLGFGSGGLLSIMSKAVAISEAFSSSSLNFANNISSNIAVLSGTIDTFNNRLGTSQMIMENISKAAISLGVDTGQLTQITQLLSTPLANRGKLGTNYSGAIKMAGNLSLASEAVGLNPMQSGEMLSRAITDHMAIHGALFARLVNTPAFKSAHVQTQSQLMGMNTDKKIDLLNTSLQQLAGDAGWLASRIGRIGTQFVILKDQIEVVLRPIGEALSKPLRTMMQWVNSYLATNGKILGERIAAFISDIFEDPKKLFINLLQLKNLGSDFKSARSFAELFLTLRFIKSGLEFIGVTFNGGLVRAAFGAVIDGFKWLAGIMPWGFIIRYAFKMIWTALSEFVPVFAIALLLFQGISRAKAIAKASDIEALANIAPRLSDVVVRWKHVFTNIMSPIQEIISQIGNLLAPLFKTSNYMEVFVSASEMILPALEDLSTGFVDLAADIAGFSALMKAELGYIFNLPNNLMAGLTSSSPLQGMKDALMSTVASDAFTKARGDFLTENASRMGKAGDSSSNYKVENNNHIEARFDMREQMEPDRIAFAVTSHLKRLALNPTQGAGQSLHGALGNPKFAGNN